jgi:hypothetical protein
MNLFTQYSGPVRALCAKIITSDCGLLCHIQGQNFLKNQKKALTNRNNYYIVITTRIYWLPVSALRRTLCAEIIASDCKLLRIF